MSSFRVLPGLPPYGETAMPVPPDWGHGAREGLVVEFRTDAGERWVGNFRPGLGGIDGVRLHPDGHNVIVVSAGAAWFVDPNRREVSELGDAIDGMWPVANPNGLVMSRQGLAFVRLGPAGRIWHTRRISFDGFQHVSLSSTEITGLAWAPWDPEWTPFRVDLRTGRVEGGSYNGPDLTQWEILATY